LRALEKLNAPSALSAYLEEDRGPLAASVATCEAEAGVRDYDARELTSAEECEINFI
jgi:hypothetical protein